MFVQADHNNMGSLSKQHKRNKMADLMVNFQGSEKCKFHKEFQGSMPPEPPTIILFGASGTRNTGHLSMNKTQHKQLHNLI